MADMRLPQTLSDLKACFNVQLDLELALLQRDPSKLSLAHQQIWKYSGAALVAGRPLGSAIICVIGPTGAGKSTLINNFFRDNTLCKTQKYTSGTTKIVFVRKALKIAAENPPILTQLSLVDIPGYFDTRSQRMEAENHAQLRQFKESRVELAKRREISKGLRQYFHVPKNVFPNLTLFVVKATDGRVVGENSQFIKSLKLLKENGGLIDMKRNNLIVVVTRVMELGAKKETIITNFDELKTHIGNGVREIFGLSRVQIIPIENNPTEYDLPMRGDYYELPIKDDLNNNELSLYNLYQAMKERLNENEDLLGRLCMAWYSNTECPDRQVPAETISTHIPIASTEVEISLDALQLIDNPPKMCKFQSLGYGYCPVTERVMPVSPLKHENKPEVVEIANSNFLIPAGISVFEEKESKSNFLTFFKKEEYEGHMHTSYGIEAGVRLVVNASFKGKWVEMGKGAEQQSWISQNHEIQVATLKLDDPMGHPQQVNFQKTLNSLPDHYSKTTGPAFRSFFSRWGSHLIYEQGIGGSIQLNCAVKETQLTRAKLKEIQTEIKAVFQRLFVAADISGENQLGASPSGLRSIGIDTEDLEICGGDPPLIPSIKNLTSTDLMEWSKSVSSAPSELKRTMKLFPYYNLIHGKRSDALRKATEDYLQNSSMAKRENEFKQNEIAMSDLKEIIKAPAKKTACFPKGTLVFINNKNPIMAIENLASSRSPQLSTITLHGKASEEMKIGKFCDTKFCTFLDAKPEVEMDYIALTFTNGKKLLVSEGHMIFQFIPEKQVVIGKQAKHFKIGEIAVYTDSPGKSPIQYPEVIKITNEKHVGAYSPLTMSGTFLAEGFLVSSYANVNSFKIAQCALAPLKMWHITPHLKTLTIFDDEDNQGNCGDDGIHPYAKFLMAFRKSFTRHGNK